MKQVVVNFTFPNVNQQQYNAVWDDIRSSGNAHPKGLLFHVGAQSNDGGLFVTDVWESEEAFKEFSNILMPFIQKAGLPTENEPSIMPVYYVYEGKHELV